MYTTKSLALIVLGAIASAIVCFAASRAPYFPTDLAIAKAVQSALSGPPGWAQWITQTADMPWCFALLGLTMIAAWALDGWRAALVALPIFFGLWGFGVWISPHIAQPRPAADLIRVVGHPKGYAFPSLFGLIYMATFGYVGVLAWTRPRFAMKTLIVVLVKLALIIGACARIVLGAHWPSDLWAAYLMGFVWIGVLMPFARSNPQS